MSFKGFFNRINRNNNNIPNNSFINTTLDVFFNVIVRFEYSEQNTDISECIESILNQTYKRVKIFVIITDDKCFSLLEKYKNDITIVFLRTNTSYKGYNNLYYNNVFKKIKNGWIMFMDNFNVLETKTSLLTIYDNISNNNSFCVWKYNKENKILFNLKTKDIELCTIAFHHSIIKNTIFLPTENNVEVFLKTIIEKNKLNFKFIKHVLVNKHIEIQKEETKITIHDILKKLEIKKYRISTIITGGLGNKLFMILNLISLATDYNLKFSFEDDLTYNIRPHSFKYSLFDSLDTYRIKNIVPYKSLRENEFKYNKITVDNLRNNYLVEGYYQSYKYFWHNKDAIKENLSIDKHRIDILRKSIQKYNKKTIALHMRLGDYKNLTDYHPIQPIEYYKKALSHYNLDEYVIILFSDEPLLALEKLQSLNYNIINANDIFADDEDQFFMISLCDVKICCNSSFSLMACYFNEIYNFVENSEYIFPDHWFGKSGPKYDMNDIIPVDNDRFKIVSLKKAAVIFFHKNIYNLYEKYWIDKSVQSILSQKYTDFDIFEINYGDSSQSIFENKDISKHNYYFYKKNYETHTEAMIFLLNEAFNKDYDIVFNTNLDDYYHPYRFLYQIFDLQYNKTFLSSSLWTYIEQNGYENDSICTSTHANTITFKDDNFVWNKYDKLLDFNNAIYSNSIDYESIKREILNKNNIINHPCICFTKEFWNSKDKYGNTLCYRDDKPYEDLTLWTRAVQNDIPISIVNKNLIYYRIHNNQIGTLKLQQEQNNTIVSTFKKEPNLVQTIMGHLFTIDSKQDILNIKHVFEDDYKTFFLFLYVKQSLVDDLNEFVNKNNINNFKTIAYERKEEDYDEIKKLFDVSIQMCCDSLVIHKSTPTIAFFTTIYKIKSKFDFETYEEWGKKLLSNLKNYTLFIFTNQETYELLKHLKDEYANIEFIIKELPEFEYHSKRSILKKNTKKKYFPKHNISYLLILLWTNRHILYNEIKERYKSDFYSHIDWGYFRENDDNLVQKIDTSKLLTDKIYFGLIKNDTDYISNIYNKIKDWNKETIEKTLIDNLYSVGGGATIMHTSMVELWISMFKTLFNKFVDKNIEFKDDQTIIRSCVFNPTYYKHFELITQGNGDWFPFIKFLNNPENDELIKNDFSFLF